MGHGRAAVENGAGAMRYDRMPHCKPVEVTTPKGDISEMEVSLTAGEVALWCAAERRTVPPGYIVEPWVQVIEGVDWILTAGIDVVSADDGA